MRQAKEIQQILDGHCGTEQYHRLTVQPCNCTDGVKFLADECGAYWLVGDIVPLALGFLRKGEEFTTFTLKKDAEGNGAQFTVTDGNGNTLLTKHYDFTDFPLPEVTLWFTGGVLLLPSEY